MPHALPQADTKAKPGVGSFMLRKPWLESAQNRSRPQQDLSTCPVIQPSPLLPVLKWPGGKRWLFPRYSHLFPKKYNRYFEPFLGGAAVFLNLNPSRSYLSDINDELINFYLAVRDDWKRVIRLLQEYQSCHSEAFYYKVRATLPDSFQRQAARLLYLNQTCFNGIYRVNENGEFNVPIGSKSPVPISETQIEEISRRLRGAKIAKENFTAAIGKSREGDFVFVDPPYTVNHNKNGFLKYNESIFSWSDQLSLHDSLLKAARRGVLVMVTNADHICIRKLYADFPSFVSVARRSVMAATAEKRAETTELVIRNW